MSRGKRLDPKSPVITSFVPPLQAKIEAPLRIVPTRGITMFNPGEKLTLIGMSRPFLRRVASTGVWVVFSQIEFRAGAAPGGPPLDLALTGLTIFVGPNNSGKSKVLQEIFFFCHHGRWQPDSVIITAAQLHPLSGAEATKTLEALALAPYKGEPISEQEAIIGKGGTRRRITKEDWLRRLSEPNKYLDFVAENYLGISTRLLDGSGRIGLLNEYSAGSLLEAPRGVLQTLFKSDTKRALLSDIVKQAFDMYLIVDPTNLGQLQVRLSQQLPPRNIERNLSDEAIDFQKRAIPIKEFSDGVKAFTGIIAEILSGDPRVILIDEPEAFLHPALCFTLGKEVARLTKSSEPRKSLFVSTHSPQFILGCMHGGSYGNIIRLTYSGGKATARVMPPDRLRELARNPLLRSAGALSGLFYESVVVTEGDADRAFYQEINERLLAFKPEWGIPNCLFLNAQNKQTIHHLIKPFRELGIPAAGIVDIDVLKEGGTVWSNLLRAASLPAMEIAPLSAIRSDLKHSFEASAKNMKVDGGIEILTNDSKSAAINLFERLQEYGLFVVPKGELESWLPELGVKGKSPEWLVSVFERIGSDPEAPDFLKPSEGDVWEFMYRVRRWALAPSRKGIP